jgi:hypothetical protein
VAIAACLSGCNDLRTFRGTWRGGRTGNPNAAVLSQGLATSASSDAALVSTLVIDDIDEHSFAARFSIAGVLPETEIKSIAGAEADVLAGLTFGGAPLRVYLAFAAMPDGAGNALLVIALYDDRRVEVRMLRGDPSPLYAIFALSESPT